MPYISPRADTQMYSKKGPLRPSVRLMFGGWLAANLPESIVGGEAVNFCSQPECSQSIHRPFELWVILAINCGRLSLRCIQEL